MRIKSGTNLNGQLVHYFLNYSGSPTTVQYEFGAGHDLLKQQALQHAASLTLGAWDLAIIEEDAPAGQ